MSSNKDIILIADDAELNREMLRVIFDEQYSILEADNGEDAITDILEYSDRICLIMLDLLMPDKSGLDVLKFMNEEGYINYIPVIMITGEATDETDEKAYELGASDIIYKPFAPNVVMRRSKNIMELFEHRIYIENKLERRTRQLRESQKKLEKNNEFLVNALSSVVEFRSLESGEHIQRVKHFTSLIIKHVRRVCPQYELTLEQCELIVNASALHDIGKIAIPDRILLKTSRLTSEEFEEMKKHTVYGCELLEKFKQDDNEFYNYCYNICRYHHERYDGKGYPDGLKGEEIPICAQVVSLADVFDALTSERVYKPAYTIDEATRMILNSECGEFSDDIINCFKLALPEMTEFINNSDHLLTSNAR